MFIDTLKDRLLDMPLPSIEAHQTDFREMLSAIQHGDLTHPDLRIELFISLQYGRGRVTLGDFMAVVRNTYKDPLFLDLVHAFERFSQSEHMKHDAKKLPGGSILISHIFLGDVDNDIDMWCSRELSRADQKKLERDVTLSKTLRRDYILKHVRRWISE